MNGVERNEVKDLVMKWNEMEWNVLITIILEWNGTKWNGSIIGSVRIVILISLFMNLMKH